MHQLIEELRRLQEKKYHKWMETFEDEDTHEEVTVERNELLTNETSDEERKIWEQIVPILPQLSYEDLEDLKRNVLSSTTLDDMPLVKELAKYDDVYALEKLGNIGRLQELCDNGNKEAAYELYYDYYYGDEEHGIFIDRVRAKSYFDLIRDASPCLEWNDNDDPGEPEPYKYEYTLKGNPETIKGVRTMIEELCQRFGTPDNELGLYVPQRETMKILVGSDTAYYRGNIMFMEQKTPDSLVLTTEAESGKPLLYALRQCFSNLEIEMEDKGWAL